MIPLSKDVDVLSVLGPRCGFIDLWPAAADDVVLCAGIAGGTGAAMAVALLRLRASSGPGSLLGCWTAPLGTGPVSLDGREDAAASPAKWSCEEVEAEVDGPAEFPAGA